MVVNLKDMMHIEAGHAHHCANMTSKVTCHVNGTSFPDDLSRNGRDSSASPTNDEVAPEDEDLTSLSWLQDNNLLRNLQVHRETAPTDSDCAEDCSVESLDDVQCKSRNGPVFHLSHVPYNPLIHINAKPPYSFSCLIFMAIENAPSKALPVKEIYSWIVNHFPYFQKAPTGWKNSVRHNLSLNKCFRKVDKDKGQTVGKGSLWSIDPEFRPNLLQAVKKIPYCPFSQLEDSQVDSKIDSEDEDGCAKANVPSPDLFPFLSKKLSVSTVKAYEVDAAATMLALHNVTSNNSENDERPLTNNFVRKMKRKKFLRFRPTAPRPSVTQPPKTYPVTTATGTGPGEDHTYSAALGQATEDCESTPPKQELPDEDPTLAEGAEALLSLAGFAKNRHKYLRPHLKRESTLS